MLVDLLRYKLTYHKIHPFKACYSTVFRKVTEFYKYYHHQFRTVKSPITLHYTYELIRYLGYFYFILVGPFGLCDRRVVCFLLNAEKKENREIETSMMEREALISYLLHIEGGLLVHRLNP